MADENKNAQNGNPPTQQPTGGEASSDVAAVAHVRLPTFWKHAPEHWFIHAEATFASQRVSANNTRVNHVLTALDEEGIRAVADLLGSSATYDRIRLRLIDVFGVSRSTRFREIVLPGGIGDRRPSQLLRDMRNAAPEDLGEAALKEFWLQKLPNNVLAIISSLDEPLDALAARADRVMEVCGSQRVDAVSGSDDRLTDLANAVRSLTQQMQTVVARTQHLPSENNTRADNHTPRQYPSSRRNAAKNSEMCYYHANFGKKARKCLLPCNFETADDKTRDSRPQAEN